MNNFPNNLLLKLQKRKQQEALRVLPNYENKIDFYSNDYLGFAQNETIYNQVNEYLISEKVKINGATGSRLISGNHKYFTITENYISKFHKVESALLFNSGYSANIGFFSCVPQKNDIILFDELCHASIRDGIQMSLANSYKFEHNNFEDLEHKIQKFQSNFNSIYIVTESVFSMDGDSPNFFELTQLTEKFNCYLVVDEAHAIGVFGKNGQGILYDLNLHNKCFAIIITYGKGLGCHGAAILGSTFLKDYLINFARSFIYTTALSPHAICTIYQAYLQLSITTAIQNLKENIVYFNQQKKMAGLSPIFIQSKSAIQSAILPGNQIVQNIANQLQIKGFNIKAILSPTVPKGQERLRVCLHAYNTKTEIDCFILELSKLVF